MFDYIKCVYMLGVADIVVKVNYEAGQKLLTKILKFLIMI